MDGSFKRQSGWFGGDGIFSFSKTGIRSKEQPLDTIAFYFSDTFIGNVKGHKPLQAIKWFTILMLLLVVLVKIICD